MRKKDYSAEIHEMFNKLRNELNIDDSFFLPRMQVLEIREKYAIAANSKKIIKELRAEIRRHQHKQRTFRLPYAGKKYTILASGKIKIEELVQ